MTTIEAIEIAETAAMEDMANNSTFAYDDTMIILILGLRMLKFSLQARGSSTSPDQTRHYATLSTTYARLLQNQIQQLTPGTTK